MRAQIQATYDAGVQEWVLWNPGSRYTVAALEPVGGFAHEPLVRVGGVLAPVSRRHEVIDSVSAVRARARTASRTAAGSVTERFLAGLDTLSAPALDSSPALSPPTAASLRLAVPGGLPADSIVRDDGSAGRRRR